MIISLLVVLYTLSMENVLPVMGFSLSIVIIVISMSYAIHDIRVKHYKRIKKISDMIGIVKEGKELSRVDEMI